MKQGEHITHQPQSAPPAKARCRGSVYLAVLGAATIVLIVGVSAITAVRAQARIAALNTDVVAARDHARSAIELGRWWIDYDPLWRTHSASITASTALAIGNGTLRLQFVDPVDGDLADSKYDRVRFIGTGAQGRASQQLQVDFDPQLTCPEALTSALHATGQIHIKSGKTLTVIGAPASTNGNLRKDGPVIGDAQAATTTGSGTVVGVLTVPAPAKTMPDADVFAAYVAIATTIAPGGNIDRQVISAGVNPYGATNAAGVYYINTSQDLRIRDSRIHGTLIVKLTSGKKLTIDRSVFMAPSRADYPALIVEGDVELFCTSDTTLLSESSTGANFNPSGAPYLNQTDSDTADSYPNEIQGLVHITGNVVANNTPRVRGLLIADGAVTVDGALTIIYDKSCAQPWSYESVAAMGVVPGSWQQVIAP